jgi:hypothetical protein
MGEGRELELNKTTNKKTRASSNLFPLRGKSTLEAEKKDKDIRLFIDLNKVLNPLNCSNKCPDLHRSQIHQEFLQPHVVFPKKD